MSPPLFWKKLSIEYLVKGEFYDKYWYNLFCTTLNFLQYLFETFFGRAEILRIKARQNLLNMFFFCKKISLPNDLSA